MLSLQVSELKISRTLIDIKNVPGIVDLKHLLDKGTRCLIKRLSEIKENTKNFVEGMMEKYKNFRSLR